MKGRRIVGALMGASLACGCNVGLGDVTYTDGSGGAGGGGGAGGVGGAGGSAAPPDCTQAQSDEFDGPALLPCWKPLELGRFALEPTLQGMGELVMSPAATSNNGWFNADHGPLFYQDVKNDFTVAAEVIATTLGSGAPTQDYNTVGLVARDPTDDAGEDWVLIDIGRQGGIPADNNVELGTMIKVTTSSLSAKTGSDSGGSVHAELGICRRGQALSLVYRVLDNGAPSLVVTPATGTSVLPGSLQVGVSVGTYVNTPDIIGHVKYVRFGGASMNPDCATAFLELIAQGP